MRSKNAYSEHVHVIPNNKLYKKVLRQKNRSILRQEQPHYLLCNKQMLLSWSLGDPFAVKRFWALWNNIYDMYCYDCCHAKAIKGLRALRKIFMTMYVYNFRFYSHS
jgi:hypothetical protein